MVVWGPRSEVSWTSLKKLVCLFVVPPNIPKLTSYISLVIRPSIAHLHRNPLSAKRESRHVAFAGVSPTRPFRQHTRRPSGVRITRRHPLPPTYNGSGCYVRGQRRARRGSGEPLAKSP